LARASDNRRNNEQEKEERWLSELAKPAKQYKKIILIIRNGKTE
jgi:hypothetical protein